MRDSETVAVNDPPAGEEAAPKSSRRKTASSANGEEEVGEPLALEAAVAAVPGETLRLLEDLFRGEFKGVRKIDREKLF